jgi:flagellar biosynthesis chaperone FliJ
MNRLRRSHAQRLKAKNKSWKKKQRRKQPLATLKQRSYRAFELNNETGTRETLNAKNRS